MHRRRLSWEDASGSVYYYYDNPMLKSVTFILLQELCNGIVFHGLTPNLQTFLKEYLAYTDSTANSYISVFTSIVYVTPLLSAVIADTLLGAYLTILIFSIIYIVGFTLLTVSSIRSVHQSWMIHLSLLLLIPLGSGGIKNCVNIMGAHQFHPDIHKTLITRYYTYFYAATNLGALIGGIATPILLQEVSFTASFVFPLFFLVVGTAIFVVGGGLMGRFVKPKPQGSAVVQILTVMVASVRKLSLENNKESNGGDFKDGFIEDVKALLTLIPLFSLVVPFVMAYNNETQKMDRHTLGWQVPPAILQSVDNISVVITSLVMDNTLYRILRKNNLMPTPLLRICIGSCCGVLGLVCALIVELQLKSHPLFTVSIWWQVPQFWLIALGEILLISTSYEIAFTHSPSSLKAVASAVNLCFFAIASALSAVLFDLATPWLPNFMPDSPTRESVKEAHYEYYYIVLMGLCILAGVVALAMIPYYNKITSQETGDDGAGHSEEALDEGGEQIK